MSRKEEVADAIAERYAGWFKQKIREAYLAGWNGAEKTMLDKAEAIIQVAKEMQENATD